MSEAKTPRLSADLLGRKSNRNGPRLAQPSPLEPEADAKNVTRPLLQPKAAKRKTADAAKSTKGTGRKSQKSGANGGDGERIRLSLRLDPERHLRLKLASVHSRKSAQQILTDALDLYLTQLASTVSGGQCACMMKAAREGTPWPFEVE